MDDRIITKDTLEEAKKRIYRQNGGRENITEYSEEDGPRAGFCIQGYAFQNVIEEGVNYAILRCDGGSHIGLIHKKDPKEKEGEQEIIITANGEMEVDQGEQENNFQYI